MSNRNESLPRGRLLRATTVALATGLVLLSPAPTSAQFGRLKEMVTGGEKGKVYEFDVTEIPSIVFVVDFSIPVQFTDEQRGQLREQLAQEAGQLAQQKLVEEGGQYAAMMAGPAGSIVKVAIAKRRDKVGQARGQVKAAIDGLSDEQLLGLITFEDGARSWHDDLVPAIEDDRDEAKDVVDKAQGGDEEGGLLGFGKDVLTESLTTFGGLALQREMMAAMAAEGAPPAGAMPGADPAAMAAAAGAGTPELPPSARFAPSAEALRDGFQAATDMGPEVIVLVVGAPPVGVSPEEFLAEVAEDNDDNVPIHVAEFGSDEGSALYRALAEQSGGTYVIAEEEEEEEEEESD